jgi:hypothetical protein
LQEKEEVRSSFQAFESPWQLRVFGAREN